MSISRFRGAPPASVGTLVAGCGVDHDARARRPAGCVSPGPARHRVHDARSLWRAHRFRGRARSRQCSPSPTFRQRAGRPLLRTPPPPAHSTALVRRTRVAVCVCVCECCRSALRLGVSRPLATGCAARHRPRHPTRRPPPPYLALDLPLARQVDLVPREGDNDVGRGLPLELLHPGLGAHERVLAGPARSWTRGAMGVRARASVERVAAAGRARAVAQMHRTLLVMSYTTMAACAFR